ncbi:hypothetical protein Vretimale_16261 [Volvox reticuliferus]|uniref:Minus agglutinin n=1 Tax=Volvox reticuliferus TaxID=1737510 RepID=A0A8J4GSR9_9CHLO|nr:hypothetical protein Vretimale_16261 [Volvox reticuliferus]
MESSIFYKQWARLSAILLLLYCLLLAAAGICRSAGASGSSYGPWNPLEDLNEQHKAVLRFILSGDTSFWSRPAVAYRIGFGTAPWRCISRCQAQYYASAAECAPDCTTQTYCEPGDAALSDSDTTCCALSLLDQSYSFSHPPNATTPDWCSTYPSWGPSARPSVCDFNVYAARGAAPPHGAGDPFLAVSCKRVTDTATFHVTGTQYRNDTAKRIVYDNNISRANATRNVVSRISLRHTAAWHHPSININEPPQFSLVDELVCLPLEEIFFEDVYMRPEHEVLAVLPDRTGPNGTTFDLFDPTTWICDRMDGQEIDLADFGFPGETAYNVAPSYFAMMLDPCGVGRALVQPNMTSLNPNLALRNVALDKCLFSPFTELNAMRWSGRARIEWSEQLRKSLELVQYGNQTLIRGSLPPAAPDPVAARPFLPDTLKRLTIKRTNDGSHPSTAWHGKPVIKGFLPSEWALLSNLEYMDLSDDMGQGLIEGPIPSTWLMMTKLRTINLTGHPNFCKDWHRIVSFQMQSYISRTPYGAVWGLPKRYYGPIDFENKGHQWNVTVFNLDGLGWQWYDSGTREAGYTNIIAPDGKCCWDTFSDQFAARNYTLEGPSGTSGPWDYYGLSYEREQLCERSAPYMPPSATKPPAPPVAPMPPDVPSAPPIPPAAESVMTTTSPPRPPLFPHLPGISPLRPYAPPQALHPPSMPGKWDGAWSWRPNRLFQSPASQSRPPLLSEAVGSPAIQLNPPQPPIECSSQAVFALPAISRGMFYVAIAVPEAAYLYCKYCGCVVEYIALQQGSSSYYKELTAEAPKQQVNSSSTSAGKTGGRVKRTDTIVGNAYSNPTPSQPSMNYSVEAILSQGFTLTRGALKEINTNPTPLPPRANDSELLRTGPGLGAAWSLDPALNGDYLFKIQVGASVWYRWVLVDIDPPFVSGALLVLKKKATFEDSTTAEIRKGRSQYLLVVLNMSEPVRNFDLAEALQLNNSATLIRSDCFESLDTAAIKAASAAYIMMAAEGLQENSRSALPRQETTLSDYYVAAAYGRRYVRSCLAVLYAMEGSRPSITLPRGAVVDLTGNPSVTSLFLQTYLKDSLMASADNLATATSAIIGSIYASSAVITTTSSYFSSVPSQSAMLQSAYHIQMLAMSANLASRGISELYERLAKLLRWSLMGTQGNLPALDHVLSSGPTSAADSISKALGLDMATQHPPPPGSIAPSRNVSRLLITDANTSLVNSPQGPTLSPNLTQPQQPVMLQQATATTPIPPPPPLDLMAVAQNMLIAWIQNMSAIDSSYFNNRSEESSSIQQPAGSSTQQQSGRVSKNASESSGLNSYIIGSGADTNDVSIDAGGRVINVSWIAPTELPRNKSSINTSATPEDGTQRLTYTLAIAGLVIGSLVLGHFILILLHKRFVDGKLNPMLEFPRVEVDTAGRFGKKDTVS